MKKKFMTSAMIFVFSLALLAGCGGGGGGGGAAGPTQHTSAVVTLSTSTTSAIPSNIIIEAYWVTIPLPAGVTVKHSADPATDTGVVVTSGGAAAKSGILAQGVRSAATGTFPDRVQVLIAYGGVPGTDTGIPVGEFSKVTGDISAGSYPSQSDFKNITLDDVQGWDLSSNSSVTMLYFGPKLTLSSSVSIN